MSELYTISEVANKLKTTKKTVYSILNSLKVDYPETEFFVRVPKRLRFSNSHIEKIVECLNLKSERTVHIGKLKEVQLADDAFVNPAVEKVKKKLNSL